MVRAWGRTFDIPYLITNCSNNYGPYHFPEKLIPNTILNALNGKPISVYGDGNQIRDFLDVRVAGDIISKITLNNQVGPINVCSGISTTVRQLAEKVADEYGRRDLLRFGARPDNLTDVPRIIGVPNIKTK